MTSNEWHRMILEASHIKRLLGGLTEETMGIHTQCNPLIWMAKTGWCKQLDKLSKKQHCSIPNTMPPHVQHSKEPSTITQPTQHHIQPGNEVSPVCAPEIQEQTYTFTHPLTYSTILDIEETERRADHRWCDCHFLLSVQQKKNTPQ